MNLPTAEEFYIHLGFMEKHHKLGVYIKTAMIEFAKLHVQEALKYASNSVKWYEVINPDYNEEFIANDMGDLYSIDKNSILNCYSLENIK